MIRFAIDGAEKGPGYVLRAEVDHEECVAPINSGTLPDSRAVALQAREFVDAAAALIESIPEYEKSFESLHDALDALPTSETAGG
jgi:hypothetical protein